MSKKLMDCLNGLVGNAGTVRTERTFGQFSRGGAVVRAIQEMWESNQRLTGQDVNQRIGDAIGAVRDEFDLNLAEWHYWCNRARFPRR